MRTLSEGLSGKGQGRKIMTDENRHFRVMNVNSSVIVMTVAGTPVCSCDDPKYAARICELLEADAQRKEKKQ